MNKEIASVDNKKLLIGVISALLFFVLLPQLVLGAANAPSDAEVEQTIVDAGLVVQGVLSGVVVIVAICVCLWIILSGLPQLKNPMEKDQVYKSLGAVLLLVIVAGGIIWIVPWAYALFQ